VDDTSIVPSALAVSAGISVTVLPAGPETLTCGRPLRFLPKSSTYVEPGSLVTAAPEACAAPRGEASVMLVLRGPWDPTAATRRVSSPSVSVSPAFMPVVEVTVMVVSPALAGAASVVLTGGSATWSIATGRASRVTVTGGRWSAISGVVSFGVVLAVRSTTLASRHPEPLSVRVAVQSAPTRRAS
jgi:hypothetical protein